MIMPALNLDKKIFNDAFYPYLFDYTHRIEVYRGSAGS
jgi:phage terminase large subunit